MENFLLFKTNLHVHVSLNVSSWLSLAAEIISVEAPPQLCVSESPVIDSTLSHNLDSPCWRWRCGGKSSACVRRRTGSDFTSRPFVCFKFPESLRNSSEISGMPMASAGLAETRTFSWFIFSTWGLTGNLLWSVDCSSFALVFFIPCVYLQHRKRVTT